MTIVEINSANYGSTGNIMLYIAKMARERGHVVYTCCPSSRSNRKKKIDNQIWIGSSVSRNLHLLLNSITGFNGCFSIIDTFLFLRKIKRIAPDVIHLHNLHNCYINLRMLFRYIKANHIKVVWTLHDCWAMTGQCPHFTMIQCEKWKTGCHDCKQTNVFPRSKVDRTKTMWKLKRKWFTGVEDLTIVTPSRWLSDIASESYLKEYPTVVINNGIDLSVFTPTPSTFRERYGIATDEKILLGVAHDWGYRKGIDVFIQLAQEIGSQYRIVLVGVEEDILPQLPPNIIAIKRTHNQKELVEIYSAADLFVNPTREENFPTVNLEALACGLPVITFNTGGSPETIDAGTGIVVESNEYSKLKEVLTDPSLTNRLSKESCRTHSKKYAAQDSFKAYIDLFEKMCSSARNASDAGSGRPVF